MPAWAGSLGISNECTFHSCFEVPPLASPAIAKFLVGGFKAMNGGQSASTSYSLTCQETVKLQMVIMHKHAAHKTVDVT